MLGEHLAVIREKSGNRAYTLQQDGARSHTAHDTIKFIEESVPDYIEEENWPPKSSDLNPLDYSIWGAMEEIVYHRRSGFDSVDELKDAIESAWDSLSQRLINGAINQWQERLQMVADQNGGHIDHLL